MGEDAAEPEGVAYVPRRQRAAIMMEAAARTQLYGAPAERG